MKYLVFLFLALVYLLPSEVWAVTSGDFYIKALVGEDTISPSTPVLIEVLPIATTQIDVDWTVATDNFQVSGYVLLRDGMAIATTTQTSFSDTGLSPSTLYTYAVYAFDSSSNISSTSNSLSTTTLAVPVVATSTPPTQQPSQSTKTVVLRDFYITPNEQSAVFLWETNIPGRFTLRWGRTDEYTGGYIANEVYRSRHETTITDLEPGTLYQYELITYTPAGLAISLKKGQFTTLAKETDLVIPNVERLVATVEGIDVVLQYQIPESELGAYVRIVRSHLGFPTDPNDGAIIYEGGKNEARDKEALVQYEKQYYTVFVYGTDGSVSSGAVTVARKLFIDSEPGDEDTETESPGESEETVEILLPLLSESDIVISQGETTFTFLSEQISLSHLSPFTLSIARTALPPHLKSIIVTLLDPTDQRRSYSFLLRINKVGTAYEATIASLSVIGTSRLEVEVYDYERKVVGRYRKQIDFTITETAKPAVLFPDAFIAPMKLFSPIIFGASFFFVISWFVLVWRRRRTEDKL